MNRNNYIFLDLETGSKNRTNTQVTQICAIALDGRDLSYNRNDIFNSEVRPIFDSEECAKMGLAEVEDEALEITHKTRKELAKAPTIDVVWPKFIDFVKRYKKGTSPWLNPVAVHFNGTFFDMPIIDRICGKEPYKLGPWDEEYQTNTLFHPRDQIDLQKWLFTFYENIPGNSLSFDYFRKIYGYPETGKSHDALVDCLEGVELFKRKLLWIRKLSSRKKFENTMNNFDIHKYL